MGTIYLSKEERQKLLDILANHLHITMDMDEDEAESFEPNRLLVLKIRDKVKVTK